MDTTRLNDNHRRVLATALLIIENSILDFEQLLMHRTEKIMQKIEYESDLTDDQIQRYLTIISEMKLSIRQLSEKYNLKPSVISFSQVLNAKKSSLWQILSDTTSRRLRRYGAFPQDLAPEIDSDIDKMLRLAEQI